LVAILLIRGYRRVLSPFAGATALEAYRELGFLRGTVLAAWRLLRCNPWSHGGVDYARDQRIFPLRGRP
jgi:putative component of membrane protein insertase Oxa1/YidC/SpoIIIJ protein YidD